MLKRYVVFAGHTHDKKGGWDDVVTDVHGNPLSLDTAEEALGVADLYRADEGPNAWSHVVDLQTGKTFYKGYR